MSSYRYSLAGAWVDGKYTPGPQSASSLAIDAIRKTAIKRDARGQASKIAPSDPATRAAPSAVRDMRAVTAGEGAEAGAGSASMFGMSPWVLLSIAGGLLGVLYLLRTKKKA